MKQYRAGLALAAALALLAGCSDDDTGDGLEPLFPADYTASYTEVRDCRRSTEHDFNMIRVLADDAALAPYRDRVDPFPVGAVVLKEEYEVGDTECAGEVIQWTVMVKTPEGEAPDQLDWMWQRVGRDRSVREEDGPGCIGCHADCGDPPDGYDGTCAMESAGG